MERVEAQQGSQPAKVVLADGREVAASAGVVVAVEGPEARRLLGGMMEVRWRCEGVQGWLLGQWGCSTSELTC